MEHAALKGEASIASMDYCVLDTDWMETAIANSYGLSLYHAKNSVTAYVCAIAKDGEEVKTGSHFWKGNDWKQFDPVATGRKAAQIAAPYVYRALANMGKASLKIWARHPLPAENIKWCWMVLLWQTFWGYSAGYSLRKISRRDFPCWAEKWENRLPQIA